MSDRDDVPTVEEYETELRRRADELEQSEAELATLRAEVERLRAVIAQTEALVSQMRRDEANRVEQIKQHWSGEVERLRAAVQRVANERDEAQVDCDRWRDAHKLAAMRADAMDWFARDSVWSANVAALAMECGLAECERERAANDDLLRRIRTLMDACDARDARLARAEGVIEARRRIDALERDVGTEEAIDALHAYHDTLAAWDEEGRSDG